MKFLNKWKNWRILLLCFLLVSISKFNTAQIIQSSQNHLDTLIVAAKEIINSARYCALITTSLTGEIHVRTMDPFSPEDSMVIWLGTNSNSRKVIEIKNNPNVTLYYNDPNKSGYVVISGKAKVIDDPEETTKRWKEEWTQFYPNREKNYILIKVVPEKMEVINYKLGIAGDPVTWQVPSIEF
ncbi:MAG: pyridoxamine 5'-phosphate oxidase family protein [Ignavibacteriaceae bacterium]|jgi:general stress protein 26|nr:pyridoxamine 5'-phosphate oxidase family protein [Ignavibacteriaceae bacterium]MCW9095404.1 pyridoxamine 5'-phosphate oxidase family protein [Ignavibacteriaceae bacterium]MCW9097800.1 pyridoxamine 5'-phosphate oxidase family protein [Ignavibacteriaceae bacterium]